MEGGALGWLGEKETQKDRKPAEGLSRGGLDKTRKGGYTGLLKGPLARVGNREPTIERHHETQHERRGLP